MTRVLIFLPLVLAVCRALTERTIASEFTPTTMTTTTERLPAGLPAEERIAENIARAKNSSQLIPVNESVEEEDTRQTDKKPRTVLHRDSGYNSRGSSCCGFKHGSSGSTRPDYNYNRIPFEIGRYPSKYNERYPIDRHEWQSQARPSSTTGSGGGGARPSAGESYGGNYGGNGIYAGSQSSDRYGPPRPAYGSESSNRPSALGYGSGNAGGYGYGVSGYGGSGYGGNGYGGRPIGYGGGGYGITGTLADGDDFGNEPPAYPETANVPPQHPGGNIHAQKAVALKALAGVALIGAAAALATNPILLPIGVVAGRKKRSESFPEEEEEEERISGFQMDYILNTLKEDLAKIQKHSSSNRLYVSPRCVARLTCEIQKNYLSDVGKSDVEILSTHRKQYLTDLIRSNVLNSVSVNAKVRDMIRLAVDVATENRSCDVFPCTYIRKG